MSTLRETRMSLTLLLLTLLVGSTSGYSSGAAESACTDLIPNHPSTTPTTSPPPFSITPSQFTYTANEQIEVTLKSQCSDTKLKGFLIQARRADESSSDRTTPIGSFAVIANTATRCSNNALTHTTRLDTSEVKLTWMAPSANEGQIVFKVTFVETISKYWVAVTSKPVAFSGSTPGPIASDSTETTVLDPSSCVVASTFTQNPACGVTLGCFSDCSDSGCNFEASWNFNGDGASADFTLKSVNTDTARQYLAIGLSSDNKMGSDSVIQCVIQPSDGSVQVSNSYNNGRANSPSSSNPTTGLSSTSGKFESQLLECSFTRDKVVNGDSTIFSLNDNYRLMFAQGSASSSGAISQHSSLPMVSSEVIDFSALKIYTSAPPSRSLIQAHGSLMVIAWILAASIGLVAARYFKPIWPTSTLFGQKIWFQIHRTSMVVTFCATCIAFVIIFVDVQDWVTSPDTVQNAHPYLGVIVTFLTIVNPIMAIFRPHPGTESRVIFNWAHWSVGTVAFVLGLITVTIGTRMGRSQMSENSVWIVVGFIVWQMLIVLCLELVQLLASKDNSLKVDKMLAKDSYELQQKPGEFQPEAPQQPAKPPAASLKIAIFLVHIVVVFAFTIALIVMIVI